MSIRTEDLFDLEYEGGAYNEALEKRLVKMYLERCKYKHALSFIQSRNIVPSSK